MISTTMKMLCRFLALAMLALSLQTANAGIIATDKAAAAAGAHTDRALVLATLSRSDVSSQLLAQGLDPALARDRVAAMTDQEVRTMAGAIATAPAGADGSFLLLVAVGVAAWYVFYRY